MVAKIAAANSRPMSDQDFMTDFLPTRNENPRPKVDRGGDAQGGVRQPSWRFLLTVDGCGFIEGSAKEIHGRAGGSSRNVRHKQPVGHALLEVPDHAGLGSWDRDRECLTRGRSELDNVGPVVFRAKIMNRFLPVVVIARAL